MNYGQPPQQPDRGQQGRAPQGYPPQGYPPQFPPAPPSRNNAPFVIGVLLLVFGGCAWRVAESKHRSACTYIPIYCDASLASKLSSDDWTKLKSPPPAEAEIPYDAQQRH